MKIEKKLFIAKSVIKLNLYNMKKIKLKLEFLKYMVPIIWKTIKFRIKVWWNKNV